jgi:hypothetical protein
MFTFWNYYVLKLIDTSTFSDATLSDINVVLCYFLSQYRLFSFIKFCNSFQFCSSFLKKSEVIFLNSITLIWEHKKSFTVVYNDKKKFEMGLREMRI